MKQGGRDHRSYRADDSPDAEGLSTTAQIRSWLPAR
jgi:hypothetical protein